jgi:hypothetical protein
MKISRKSAEGIAGLARPMYTHNEGCFVMLIYLDNCCFNRPFDDQSQARVRLEAEAKLEIQQRIKDKKIELTSDDVIVKRMQGFAHIMVMNPTQFIVEVE